MKIVIAIEPDWYFQDGCTYKEDENFSCLWCAEFLVRNGIDYLVKPESVYAYGIFQIQNNGTMIENICKFFKKLW